jgi:hypothetical protein
MFSTVIHVSHVQLAACILYRVSPRGPTRHTYVPMSPIRTLSYSSQLIRMHSWNHEGGLWYICNTTTTPTLVFLVHFFFSLVHAGEDFLIGHPSYNCSGPNIFNSRLSGISILSTLLNIESGCRIPPSPCKLIEFIVQRVLDFENYLV